MVKIAVEDEDDPSQFNEAGEYFPKSRYYVYCYKNKVNGKCYVGKTNNISQRKSKHRRLAFTEKSQLPFYRAIRKYGEDNFEFTVLDTFCWEDIIFDLEKFYIKAYKANQREFGYNITEGGEGSSGTRHNENQKRANKLRVGTKNGRSKLNDELVLAMFEDYRTGNFSMIELASQYNISAVTVERILSGRSWKHLNLDVSSLKHVKKINISRSGTHKDAQTNHSEQ